jgi:hypothetical protein
MPTEGRTIGRRWETRLPHWGNDAAERNNQCRFGAEEEGGDDDGSVPGTRHGDVWFGGGQDDDTRLFRGFDLLAPRSVGIALAQVKFQANEWGVFVRASSRPAGECS